MVAAMNDTDTDSVSENILATGLPARRASLRILNAVLAKSRPLDEALESDATLKSLPKRDRAFVRLLTATVLRRLGQVDEIINRFLTREPAGNAVAVRNILRLATVQLLFLETPAHAAVGTAVDLAEAERLTRYKGLINAVLRNVVKAGPAALPQQDPARLNTPDWLWDSWCGAYGATTARTIALTHLGEASLDLSVKEAPRDWSSRLDGVALPWGSVRLKQGGDVTALPGFHDGGWWVQDAAAALPALLLGDIKGKHVIDLCAAPGGKTAQLAAEGARVTAVDRSANRMKRLSENMERLGLPVDTIVSDAVEWQLDEPADAVLIDAPCSGTGTLRRHPDIARVKTQADVAKLAVLQEKILIHAASLVKPGGLLVYATCSLQPEEGPDIVGAVLETGAPLDLVPIEAGELPGLGDDAIVDGCLRTHPGLFDRKGGLDGFFAARFRRQ